MFLSENNLYFWKDKTHTPLYFKILLSLEECISTSHFLKQKSSTACLQSWLNCYLVGLKSFTVWSSQNLLTLESLLLELISDALIYIQRSLFPLLYLLKCKVVYIRGVWTSVNSWVGQSIIMMLIYEKFGKLAYSCVQRVQLYLCSWNNCLFFL